MQGFFGAIEGANISNLGLSNAIITSTHGHIGSLVNSARGTTIIENCYTENVSIVASGNYVGGLVGQMWNDSSISFCYSSGSVKNEYECGGLVGVFSGSTMSTCYSTCSVTGVYTNAVGGLIASSKGSIENCYATGNVVGQRAAGGLVGDGSYTSFKNCYATGNVKGGDDVGGLVGKLGSDSSLKTSYATGNVTGGDTVGGLVGYVGGNISSDISNSYATGNVSGNEHVGGFAGNVTCNGYRNIYIIDCSAYGSVNCANPNSGGAFIGSLFINNPYTLKATNCTVIPQGMNTVGGVYVNDTYTPDYDQTVLTSGIKGLIALPVETNMLVGINADESCQLKFNTNFSYDISAISNGIETQEALFSIDNFIQQLSEQSTQLGAIQNRLESVLESLEVSINNLTSSRSTIRDADIAEVSSHYIQQQILQQASATLLATANQSPSIALQLI